MTHQYAIIYDNFVTEKKYNKIVTKVDQQLNLLEIKGKKLKLNALNTLRAVAKDQAQKKIKNIIVLGDNKTFTRIIDIIIPYNVILGFIPIGKNNTLSNKFGINDSIEACKIISQRNIKKFFLPQVNNKFFLSSIEFNNGEINIECNNEYIIKSDNKNIKFLINYSIDNNQLHLNTLYKKQTCTNILIDKINISKETSQQAIVDYEKMISFPINIKNSDQSLNIMVGRNRINI